MNGFGDIFAELGRPVCELACPESELACPVARPSGYPSSSGMIRLPLGAVAVSAAGEGLDKVGA